MIFCQDPWEYSFIGLIQNSRKRPRKKGIHIINNNKCLYCSLDKNTYLMLQDKKIKSSAKLKWNKKIKTCEKLGTYI